MTDKQKFEVVSSIEPDTSTDPNGLSPEQLKQIEQDERDLKAIMLDQPGVAASAVAAGTVAVGTGRPPKDEFFRCHSGDTFHPLVPMVATNNKMDRVFCTVAPGMLPVLASLHISVAPFRIYLVQTEADIWRLVPVRQARKDGNQNIWDATLEVCLHQAMKEWIRIYNDPDRQDDEGGWKKFPAAKDRFPDPVWPALPMATLIRLAFKDRGNHIDSPEHPLVQKWSGGNRA
jgi:hypothetical protein